jgi:threonine synthase
MNVTHLSCSQCEACYEPGLLYNLCQSCGKPLLVHYDLQRIADMLPRTTFTTRPATLWRYRELLPVVQDSAIVTLGEGWTPLIHARRLGAQLGMPHLYIKDESSNPTASFKARGMAVAVSMAKELGVRKLAAPSAGNAASALAAYAATAGLEAHIFMPKDVPLANLIECRQLGAQVT